jgi:cytolysin (calcineurin-like family phosphatase)
MTGLGNRMLKKSGITWLILLILTAFSCAPKPEAAVEFFIISDTHYGVSETVAAVNQDTVRRINAFNGTPLPDWIGGHVIQNPRGIVVVGDLVDNGDGDRAQADWDQFMRDFGVDGEGLAAFPVYEGFGNHDGGPDSPVRRGICKRNPKRKDLAGISSNGLHYSWDWGPVHCVQLNLFPGAAGEDIINPWGEHFEGEWRFPQHSLDFLIDDLKENVGKTDRPVVLFQHYGWDQWGLGWWSENERDAFHQAIKDYNVLGIFWGHSHTPAYINWRGLDTWCVGTAQRDPHSGEFMAVRISSGQMAVALWKDGGWMLQALKKFRWEE